MNQNDPTHRDVTSFTIQNLRQLGQGFSKLSDTLTDKQTEITTLFRYILI